MEIESTALRLAQAQIQRYAPYYNQIPNGLMRDKNILPESKALYGLLHSYSSEKDLTQYPKTQISFETIQTCFGYSEVTIRKWFDDLRKGGWIEKIRMGRQSANLYILYPVCKDTFEAIKNMKRVHLKINTDPALAKRLKKSIN